MVESGTAPTAGHSGDRPPPMPPVVFLRGAGVTSRVFQRVTAALWRHGLWTTTNRTQAMHLSRGGLTVWMLDFSLPPHVRPDETAVSLGEVRAVMDESRQRMEFKRIRGQQLDRPTLDGDLDEETLAARVAAEITQASGT